MSDKKEYWRWKESNWKDPELDWGQGKVISAGVDIEGILR